MNNVILFRVDEENKDEYEIAKKIFNVRLNRSSCSKEIVIGRYSVLPYYQELEIDLANNGCKLINTYWEHKWVADFGYYNIVKEHTFETWTDPRELPEGQFVVKGRTNSRKSKWNTLMYAKDRQTAIGIGHELSSDPLIGSQGIIYRRYEELELIEEGINGQRFVNEHRIFYYKNKRLAHGYYWTQSEKIPTIDSKGLSFAQDVAEIVKDHVNFFVLDIARNTKGEWRLVEINDGQMSGLSHVNPYELYTNLRIEIENGNTKIT